VQDASREQDAEPSKPALQIQEHEQLIKSAYSGVKGELEKLKEGVIVLVPCGCSRGKLLELLIKQSEGLFSKAYVYRGFRIEAEEIKQRVERYESLQELDKLKKRKGELVIVVPESSWDAVYLRSMLGKRVKLLYLPELYEKAIKEVKGFSEEVCKLAKVEHPRLRRMFEVKAEGLSSTLLREWGEKLDDLEKGKKAILELSPRKLGLRDYLRDITREVSKVALAAHVSTLIVSGIPFLLIVGKLLFSTRISFLALNLLDRAGSTIKSGIRDLLAVTPGLSKLSVDKLVEALSAGILRTWLEGMARDELVEGIAKLAVKARGAEPYLDRKELETVWDQVALRWGLPTSLFKDLIRKLAEMMRGESGTEEELERRIRQKIEDRISEIEKEIAEMRREIDDIKERLEVLEEERIIQYANDEDELIEALKIEWVKKREPVVSDSLREKIEEAVEHVKKGEKVCIIGEAGVGKTTALYLACLHLMSEGIRLRISGIRGRGVLVVDNVGAKRGFLRDLERFCITPVIASIRASEWRPGVWYEIRIEPEDQRPKLREMFISMLKANEVEYMEEAVDEIMKRDPTPIFLSTVAEDFKKKKMSIEDVSRIPKDLYEYIAKVINESGDDLAAAILYCIAKTKTGWLYRDQLEILRELLKKEGILKGSGRYEKLLAKLNESFGIRHDVWRDVITLDTERLPESLISSAEMDVVRRIWKYGEGLIRLTKKACKESLNHIKDMEAREAANLAKRALENFPDLSEDAFRIALEEKEDKRDLILDVIAIEAPDPLMRIEIDKAEKLAYEINAPNAEAVLFGRLSSYYRDLASKDKRFLPDLAMTLNNLGVALGKKGLLDDAIKRYDEALKIYRDLAERDKRFLPDLAGTLNNLGNALYKKGLLDDAIKRYDEALKVMEPLSDRPWFWDIISESHIRIALLERDKKGAAEHLCAALKMLTDERAPKTYYLEVLLEDCISYLKKIPEELIPEECREKLVK